MRTSSARTVTLPPGESLKVLLDISLAASMVTRVAAMVIAVVAVSTDVRPISGGKE